MPIARFELPDGRIGRFEVPEGTTPDQAMQLISSNLQDLLPKETPANDSAISVPDKQLVKVPAQPVQQAPEPSLGSPMGDDFASAIANVQRPEYQSVLAGTQLPQENLQGLNPNFIANMQKNLDAMDLDKRQQTIDRLTQQENTVGGRAAKIISDRYKAMDLQPEKAKFATDLRLETQADRYASQGLNAQDSINQARLDALRGQSRPDFQQMTPDIVGEQADKAVQEQAKELEGAGFLTRVGAEAKSQLAQTGMGLMQNYADLIGDTQMSKDLMGAQRVESEKGANVPTGPSLFEKSAQHAIATLATQAPVMAIGTITGTAAPMLAFAGVQQYGQAYGEGRQAGLDPVAASARAGLQAAAEVMFEQFGMPKSLAGLKTLFKEAPNKKPVTANDVAAYFMNAIAHELPTELATTATQYGIDILPGIGTNKNPSMADLYEQLAETLRQTVIQSGATAGAAIGATKGTQAAQRQLEKTEFGRNLAVANAIKKDVANAEFTQEGINKDVVARLNPNSYAYAQFAPEEMQRPPLTAANIEKQEAAEKVLQEPKEGDVAPPSNSQDTQAMLDELNGKEITNATSSTDTANQTIARTEPQAAPAAQPAPHTLEEIADKGEPVQTKQEAEKAHSDGDTVYGFHEQDEENPVLIKNIDDLKGFTPDQLLVVPKEEIPEVKPKIGVSESAITPLPVLEGISKTAVGAINTANGYVQRLAEALPTAKDPDAHQNAIEKLNNASNAINEKGQIVAEESSRKNKKTPGEQNRAIQAAQKELNKALIEHDKAVKDARKLLGDIKKKEAKPQVRKVRPAIEDLPYPKTQEQMDLEERNKDLEVARRKKARLQKEGGLFGALRKSLSLSEIKNISPENHFLQLKSPNDEGRLVDIVSGSAIEDYLPHDMRYKSPTFDPQQSEQYIIEKLQSGKYMTYDAEQEIERLTGDIDYIEGNIKELEDLVKEQLELKDVNLLIEEAADEQRKADQANQVYEPEHEAGVSEPGENELALKSETPDEVRAKERAKEERAKAEREAEARAKANEGVSDFTLTGSDRPADQAAARGQEDLFGQPKVEAKPAEMEALNDKIHDAVDKKSQEFLPGDHVTLGTVPGIVLGVEGDYVKFKPDSATNPKAYQRVPAKSLSFEFRPGREPKASASKASDKETGTEKGKLNADMGGLIKLLGANMYAANIADVSVKELLQNAFDASKAAVKLGIVKVGKIDIVVNAADRTITVKDNARGMTPSIVKDAFFTVAGSDKSDLDPKERSGGLGLAKMGFMLGSERLKLDTVRDGIRTTVDTDSQAIADSKFDIKKTKAPEKEHGTSVTVTIPENYTDPKTGEQKGIWFPWSIESLDALTQPLVGPVEVNVDFNGEKETLPIGVNFNQDKMPKLTTVHFSWGDADVYFGVERKESSGYTNRPNHKVLSSGVYQFKNDFALNDSEVIPYDILINVKPDVDAKHPDYPFENSRERFKARIEKDIKSLGQYLKQVAMGNEAKDLQENFKGIVSMPRIEAGADVADASKKLKKAFDTRSGANEKKFEPPAVPKEIYVSDGFVKTKTGKELVKPEDQKKESTFKAEKEAPKMADFMLEMKQDPKLPVFHNNTNVDYLEIGRQYGDPEKFFAELGTLLVEMKEDLSKSGLYRYDMLKPENLFFGGISIDKKYGGVHIRVPYKGVFVNPFYDFGQKSLFSARETILITMIHEIAHTADMDHGVGHNNQMIKVANYLADSGMLDYYRDAILDTLTRHESAFAAMKEAYGKSTTQNTSKSLEDYGKSSASSTSGPAKGVGVNQPSAVQAGGRQGSLLPVPTAGQAGGPGQVNQGGGGTPIGPQGQLFPGLPPPKRNIYGKPVGNSRWELEPETKIGHLIDTIDHAIVDKHVDTRKVQAAIKKSIGAIDDAFDVYMKEELYHGRTANAVKDFLDDELSPVISDAIKENLTIPEIEQYLHNRTAEERNDAIAKINDRFSDVNQNPGSGISTIAARAYFANLDPKKETKLKKVAEKIDKIIKKTQQILVDNGLETQDVIDNWNNAYEHYVPLMRDQEELDFKHHGSGLGKGFQVKGSASKRAYGSTKTVVDILANIAMQRESAIIRSEKARVGRALYGLALKNPNPDFWLPVNPDAIKDKTALYKELISMGLPVNVAQNFIQEPTTPSIDPVTGKVVYRINPALRNSDNVFPVRINGKDRYVFFNTKDEKAMRMAAALSNLDPQTLGGILGTTAMVTRWFASVNTQFNPVFGVINFARDAQGAIFNLTNTPLAGKQKEVLSHVFPAMFAIIGNERAARKNQALTTYWSDMYDRMRRAGGTTGFREAFARGKFSGKDTTIIERELKKQTRGAAMRRARFVFDLLSDYNDGMENAVRLSVFKVALDNGLSEDRAASLAKNITINFNRKGQNTPYMQALFAFFNPAVQGTVKLAQVLSGPAGRKIMAGGFIVGVIQAIALAAMGFDNDEPPDYVKDKNFIFPLSNGKYLFFPMPPGFNVFPGVARIATEYVLGRQHLMTGAKSGIDATAQVMTLFADAFNPLGSGSFLQQVTPTPLDPIAAVYTNKDAFGRPIYKEDMATKPTPGFMRSRENATAISQAIAHFLNDISSPSGTQFTKGKISPTADELDYYAGQLGGGAVREVMKAAETLKAPFTSEPLPSYRVPLAGRFYGDVKSQAAIQDKFYNNITLMNKYANEITNIQKSGQDPSKYMNAHPDAQFYASAAQYNEAVNQMNQNKKVMLRNKVPMKDIRENEAQKVMLMKQFNDQVAQIQKHR